MSSTFSQASAVSASGSKEPGCEPSRSVRSSDSSSVLRKHWPNVRCYDDIKTLTADRLLADGIAVDLICGGFPCQDISYAGEGQGIIEGTRSGLWIEFARIIGELRPRYVIVENVSALLAEEWAKFSETWPQSGMIRNGIAWMLSMPVFRNIARVCGLSPIPHDRIASRYFLRMPSMLNAIERGYMDKVETMPTLTTKIVDRAPCPYWETLNGPRYLSESEAEIMSGFPLGWTDTKLSATPSSRKSRKSSDRQS